jgi:hypothetical protein
MSITITAQAVPSVANSSWEVVDDHLYRENYDWATLRNGLIHLLCKRVTHEGNPVTRLEELLINEFYKAPSVRITFLDVLELIRKETDRWSPGAIGLTERILARDPRFPACKPAFPLTLEHLRIVATASEPVPPPKRDFQRFINSHDVRDTTLNGGRS